MRILNASGFTERVLDSGLKIYGSPVVGHSDDELELTDIASARKASTWRARYRPFAFVIVDLQSRETVLVRDHLGVAPLYYAWTAKHELIFGETIPDILRGLGTAPKLERRELRKLFYDAAEYSDETLYRGIRRVEPGTLIYIPPRGALVKEAYWQLRPDGPTLQYADERDYLLRFTELLHRAVERSVAGHSNLAAEFSAGLDSSAVYCAAHALGHRPKLYMNGIGEDAVAQEKYQVGYEESFLAHFGIKDLIRISPEGFEPLAVFDELAGWFAGPPTYIFPMFALPLHRAVAAGKHSILLSGFGGDQGVSGNIPKRFILPELIRDLGYRGVWPHLDASTPLRKTWECARYSHPLLYRGGIAIQNLKRRRRGERPVTHAIYTELFPTVRMAEWAFLQGPFSREIRMRIETSSVVSRKLGFQFRYPLLDPELLEFFLRVPHTQKRQDGIGRALIRRYLAAQLGVEIFGQYKKHEGLGIFTGTLNHFRKRYAEGKYQDKFKKLPYERRLRSHTPHFELTNRIKAYMLKAGSNLEL